MPELRTNADAADHLKALIRAWKGVEDVSINSTTGSVAIRYRTTAPDDEFQANILASIGKATHWHDDEAPAGVTRHDPQAPALRQPDARQKGTGPARRQRTRLR